MNKSSDKKCSDYGSVGAAFAIPPDQCTRSIDDTPWVEWVAANHYRYLWNHAERLLERLNDARELIRSALVKIEGCEQCGLDNNLREDPLLEQCRKILGVNKEDRQ